MTDEEFYDAEIAPTLADLCKRCQDRGLAFLAVVQYDADGNIGQTVCLPKGAPPVIRYANTLATCGVRGGVNIDGFMLAVAKEARQTGHSSVVLKQMGVPLTPAPTP